MYFAPHTCRFCKGHIASDDGVHYAAKHWAHFHCYLDAGRKLADLPSPAQIGSFPWKVLRERGLLAEADALTAGRT